MTVKQAVVMGVLQGFTEFLPISSDGHLAAARGLLHWTTGIGSLTFDVLLHVASLAAVLVALRREIVAALTTERRMLWVVVVATLPMGLAALADDALETVLANRPAFAGVALMFTGLILYLGSRAREGYDTGATLRWRDALKVGFAQLVAILPGVSRSGMTIVMGQSVGLDRQAAITFSFLLFIPAVCGAAVLKLPELGGPGTSSQLGALAAGMLAAFVSSLMAISLLRSVVRRWGVAPFAGYCLVVGAAVLGLSFFIG